MKSKLKVGIIFGGKSAEHEVSLQSAKNIYQAINKDKYDVVLIGIDKQGQWLLSNDSQLLIEQNNPRLTKLNLSNEVALVPQSNGKLVNVHTGQSHHSFDFVFPEKWRNNPFTHIKIIIVKTTAVYEYPFAIGELYKG